MSQTPYDVLIIGAGLAGLTAARLIFEQGFSCLVLEASDSVGGRVKTDQHEGFLLDHGFQVLLSAYPEARALLNYNFLALKPFYNGSLIWTGHDFQKVADPWRHPVDGLQSVYNKIGTLKDKLKVAELRQKLITQPADAYWTSPETTTREYLKAFGFSEGMVDVFFRPFLGGIFLEPDLATSSRFFEFVFRMFSTGDVVLPAEGMGAIPRQLAEGLPEDAIFLNRRVSSVQPDGVRLETGELVQAKCVLVATDALDALSLLPQTTPRSFNQAHCLYFAAQTAPLDLPILALNGVSGQLVNNLCVPSLVAPSYAPEGQHLISVSVLENSLQPEPLVKAVIEELRVWFGDSVDEWRFLKAYPIRRALPRFTVPPNTLTPQPVQLAPGLFSCGDYLDTPSINGAMATGRRAANAILEALKAPALTT
ncbi:FAD-dependent oxidoreductase [Vampirovibrio sp.]|uniref:NAD(P)/FAD-dependent oxidoreductase n=1 Tax=Vampirovibrio sp. TaxID=2717857 RepID=UPI0035937728